MEYVWSTDPDVLTPTQRLVLVAIVYHHTERYNSANVGDGELAGDVGLSPRHLRRIIGDLQSSGLIEYRAGRGAGNYSQFRFPQLPAGASGGVKSVKKSGQKADKKRTFSISPIRKENLNQKQCTPLSPLPRRGDFRLSQRQHSRLSKSLYEVLNSLPAREPGTSGVEWPWLLHETCANLVIPYDDALHDLLLMDSEVWGPRLGHKKQQQSA